MSNMDTSDGSDVVDMVEQLALANNWSYQFGETDVSIHCIATDVWGDLFTSVSEVGGGAEITLNRHLLVPGQVELEMLRLLNIINQVMGLGAFSYHREREFLMYRLLIDYGSERPLTSEYVGTVVTECQSMFTDYTVAFLAVIGLPTDAVLVREGMSSIFQSLTASEAMQLAQMRAFGRA